MSWDRKYGKKETPTNGLIKPLIGVSTAGAVGLDRKHPQKGGSDSEPHVPFAAKKAGDDGVV